MPEKKLTPDMERALSQIGFGIFGRAGGFYDEDGKRLDLRSAQALYTRGLVTYHTTGGAPLIGCLDLTPAGWESFEEIQERRYQEKR